MQQSSLQTLPASHSWVTPNNQVLAGLLLGLMAASIFPHSIRHQHLAGAHGEVYSTLCSAQRSCSDVAHLVLWHAADLAAAVALAQSGRGLATRVRPASAPVTKRTSS